jgi:hypothetical protein
MYMLRGAFSKCWKPGNCELCGVHTHHLERHHLKYDPEITIDLCHNCHFKAHFFPNRLPRDHKLKLLCKLFPLSHALSLLEVYSNRPVALAQLFAPSRREHIHKAQMEEEERIKKIEKEKKEEHN